MTDQSAQDYIRRIGLSLIPDHQKNLADDNPFRVPFQFFLVEDKSTDLIAYPNGVIIVPSGVFDHLENEAQLAFLLSDAITGILERGIWRLLASDRALKGGLAVAIIAADLTLPLAAVPLEGLSATMTESTVEDLTSQAERVGMERMLEAGYDVREAPRAWKSIALTQPPLLLKQYPEEANRADLDAGLATHRALLMAELRENFAGVDYSALKKDSDEFHAVAQRLAGAGKKRK